jgi:tRNA-Thr(GGU) m(6)t(6)A37 methyltransferase TsaA
MATAKGPVDMKLEALLMTAHAMLLQPIGYVRSELASRDQAPRQGSEGAPNAWIEIDGSFVDGLDGIEVGHEIIVLTWLHRGRRDVLKVHPRGDRPAPLRGVFATRSPDRPNPIGLHRVRVIERLPDRIRVGPLEAIDGTPVVDIS